MKFPKFLAPAALALTAFSLALPAHAVLKETTTMKEVFEAVTPDTLVLFDLDNTVVEATQALGSDMWYDHLIKEQVDQGVNKDEAVARAMSAFKRVNAISRVKPVEPFTPRLIAAAQSQHVAIMGLTARPTDFADRTREQLASIGVDLSRTSLVPGSFDVAPGVKLDRGIVFVTGQDKGVALLAFLKQIHFKPKRVIFADDKLHNVQDVERALDTTDIEHISFRYGAADEDVRNYDPALAEIQGRYFGRILDDAAAAKLKD